MLGKKRNAPIEESKVFFISKTNEVPSAIISNKPLWISDVSQSVKKIFPNPIEMKDFEQIKDLMQTETSEEMFDNAEYPYYHTIKKIMYAFGDCYSNNQETVIHMHDFIKKFLLSLNQIFNECDYKKIIEHFFSYEYEKLHNYKKLKFKNNIITGENDSITGEELKICANDTNFGNDNNIIISDDDDSFTLENKKKANHKKKSEFDNEIDDKDEYYTENILFQSERTENMDTNQYLEYYSCRQHGFLTKGKKAFMDYLQALLGNKTPNEFKDNGNCELIAFILKEEIKKIVIESIKAKHPEKKLFVLSHPLTIKDIEDYCCEEIAKLTEFLNDFHSNMSLIKIFKKKQISYKKSYNKNAKVKKTDKGLFIIIKKYVLIENKEEAELFKTIKQIAELQVLNAFLILRDKYVLLKHDISKQQPGIKPDYCKLNFTGTNQELITIQDLIVFLGIDNYYEYFLIKDYLLPINLKDIKIPELISKISQLAKLSKRTVGNKFNNWLQMSNDQKNDIINQFNGLIGSKVNSSK